MEYTIQVHTIAKIEGRVPIAVYNNHPIDRVEFRIEDPHKLTGVRYEAVGSILHLESPFDIDMIDVICHSIKPTT